jgi:hypothetical protein
MKRMRRVTLASFLLVFGFCATCRAQSTGSVELVARITPTAARPEPVRQFTFFVLSKSYSQIAQDVESQNPMTPRDAFIDSLKVSPELRTWLKAHDVMDLTLPETDKLITADDIIQIPEFLLAYQRSNSGGVTQGIPKPKYADADKTANPERYQRQHQEYLTTLKKFIVAKPETVSGIELELDGVNPQRRWARIESDHRRRVQHMAPDIAQTKYLVAKGDTDLEGHVIIPGLPPGNYWISTLNLDANAGDQRLRWDVPIQVQAGQTVRAELTNLNATDSRSASNP